ncbi:hypothetical protein FSW04_20375 [Baekduia soli]|uniref:Uncharacterized protein n=1 Tax=Baekduia soli TaxID=496014 RepID=A0A5B8U9H1_9ACTN|nr:hypothetical protein [Baekduia soli]QEC49700.1 hypothetical protein FSW04_20375 [Baekduia soli]
MLASAVVLGLLISSFAVASGEGGAILGGKRNPGSNESAALSRETQIIANTGTYGTRQSNKSDNGGGAIYGCRSKAGGSPKGNEPCVRASNLADGRAFEFESKGGTEVGAITSSNAAAAPFTTNAHGVATGLNADQVDGKSADDIQNDTLKAAHTDAVATAQGLSPFAAVDADGTLGGNRGATSASRTGAGTYTVVFANDVSGCALSATETQFEDAGAVGVQLGGDHKTVTVRTRAGGGADGTGATAPTDRPFHLVATC